MLTIKGQGCRQLGAHQFGTRAPENEGLVESGHTTRAWAIGFLEDFQVGSQIDFVKNHSVLGAARGVDGKAKRTGADHDLGLEFGRVFGNHRHEGRSRSSSSHCKAGGLSKCEFPQFTVRDQTLFKVGPL